MKAPRYAMSGAIKLSRRAQISSGAAGTMTRVSSIGFERRRCIPLVDRTLCPPQLLDGAFRQSCAMPAPPSTPAAFRSVQRTPEQR